MLKRIFRFSLLELLFTVLFVGVVVYLVQMPRKIYTELSYGVLSANAETNPLCVSYYYDVGYPIAWFIAEEYIPDENLIIVGSPKRDAVMYAKVPPDLKPSYRYDNSQWFYGRLALNLLIYFAVYVSVIALIRYFFLPGKQEADAPPTKVPV